MTYVPLTGSGHCVLSSSAMGQTARPIKAGAMGIRACYGKAKREDDAKAFGSLYMYVQ